MQDISSNDSTYKIPIHISQNVQIESSDNLLVVGAPKQESAEKILIPNLLSGTSSYLVIDPDGIICNKSEAALPVRIFFAFSIMLLIMSIIGCIMDYIRKIKEKS